MTDDLSSDLAAISRIKAVPAILQVICQITGMGFAAVARVTDDRWIACSVLDGIQFGLQPGGELKLETTICNEIRGTRTAVIIDDVAQDAIFCVHPTPAMYGFQSYISMPIVLPDGSFFGTLCAIDPRPARLSRPEVIGMFKLFADLIALHLDALQRLATSETTLLNERETAELREQFIAVLGHDLRNPLASIDAGATMLLRSPLDDKARGILHRMQGSVRRMTGLIEDVVDFARGRLGGGLALRKAREESLEPVLAQVIAELSAAHPGRLIEADIAFEAPVRCDAVRIGQMASNLVANALIHGAPDGVIHINAGVEAGMFELSVANSGDPIPQLVRDRIFQPFFRASQKSNQQGLGLGLYIASEIARAHGGTLALTSSPDETRFTFRMPAG